MLGNKYFIVFEAFLDLTLSAIFHNQIHIRHGNIIVDFKNFDDVNVRHSFPDSDFVINCFELIRHFHKPSFGIILRCLLVLQFLSLEYFDGHFLFTEYFFAINISINLTSCMLDLAKASFAYCFFYS